EERVLDRLLRPRRARPLLRRSRARSPSRLLAARRRHAGRRRGCRRPRLRPAPVARLPLSRITPHTEYASFRSGRRARGRRRRSRMNRLARITTRWALSVTIVAALGGNALAKKKHAAAPVAPPKEAAPQTARAI